MGKIQQKTRLLYKQLSYVAGGYVISTISAYAGHIPSHLCETLEGFAENDMIQANKKIDQQTIDLYVNELVHQIDKLIKQNNPDNEHLLNRLNAEYKEITHLLHMTLHTYGVTAKITPNEKG